MISRIIESNISPMLGSKKAILIMGARQVGKFTLLQQLLSHRYDSAISDSFSDIVTLKH